MAGLFQRVIEKVQHETKYYGHGRLDRKRELELIERLHGKAKSSAANGNGSDQFRFQVEPSVISGYTAFSESHRSARFADSRRASDTGSVLSRAEFMAARNGLSNAELQHLINRLQRPTVSYDMKKKRDSLSEEISTDDESPTEKKSPRNFPVEALSQMTNSRRAKQPWRCSYCEENPYNAYHPEAFLKRHASEKTGLQAYREHVKQVVERLTRPTELVKIRRESEETRHRHHHRQFIRTMPLISGLDRSKDVNEVVNRLYSTTK